MAGRILRLKEAEFVQVVTPTTTVVVTLTAGGKTEVKVITLKERKK